MLFPAVIWCALSITASSFIPSCKALMSPLFANSLTSSKQVPALDWPMSFAAVVIWCALSTTVSCFIPNGKALMSPLFLNSLTSRKQVFLYHTGRFDRNNTGGNAVFNFFHNEDEVCPSIYLKLIPSSFSLPYNSSSPFSSDCNFLLVACKKHTRNGAWKKQTESLFFHSPPPTHPSFCASRRKTVCC